jgi:hypothetical protein
MTHIASHNMHLIKVLRYRPNIPFIQNSIIPYSEQGELIH